MKKIEISELLKRIAICLLCIAIMVSIALLFAYMHTMLLSKGCELAANYVSETMPYVLLTVFFFIAWFIYDQVLSKMKEVELPIEIELANSDNKTTLKDVIIDDSLRQELEVTCCNKMTEEVRRMLRSERINLQKDYILHGPPGNGKTLIARAIAGESNMNFISISGPELIGVYIGHGAHVVRELFKVARKYSPCIIFIDEIDAVAQKRSTANNSAYHCRESLTQLLTEIDGFKSRKDIIVIGATNLVDEIDPALIRPGRLGQIVHIPNPNVEARQKILELYTKNIKIDKRLLKGIAEKTEDYSGAKLEQLVNEARKHAILKRQVTVVSEEDFKHAFHKLNPGQGRGR
ncbi:ATP-binding protein [Wolbachia endosymbiont (group A) of Barypeithes pellucidus]|uniref:ATP-binding protein n=1 Tax=Wolbachia endosymbiont (group A) of Barypeithes pellucidus TaxID=3139322 RepID=UPI003CCAE181